MAPVNLGSTSREGAWNLVPQCLSYFNVTSLKLMEKQECEKLVLWKWTLGGESGVERVEDRPGRVCRADSARVMARVKALRMT